MFFLNKEGDPFNPTPVGLNGSPTSQKKGGLPPLRIFFPVPYSKRA